ncbi:MAG: bifunctional phosphoribosylaminoimidazolecarboxamide formyltransferase/IMP cyclohydrolase [Candidatus Cloacimonetes bacterium]|nr:bifunctional phosphoribosylaminoimidazolecarboxamide formyltransferase/IMP cyclohydrolase [Candidatus Cloacimonadota bacterium]
MQKRAIISVSDKTGIVEFARKLKKLDFEIISTGGTYKELSKNGIRVKQVSEITGFPEIMDGRVKTLHPAIHGGILADKSNPKHLDELMKQNIGLIDLVVVNLYPFRKTISQPDVSLRNVIENIDIGGPTMIRAAAKNFQSVTVVVDKNDYNLVADELSKKGDINLETRRHLAKKAFQYTAEYDSYIANYFSKLCKEKLPSYLNILLPLNSELRYGENPHQKAGYYIEENLFTQLHGKQLSFNNLQDVDAALKTIYDFRHKPTIAILKHCNPCGIGLANNLTDAYKKAFATDTMSPFGGIVITNQVLDLDTSLEINKVFTEIILAPEFAENALEKLKKKKNRRLLTYDIHKLKNLKNIRNIRSCLNGILIQDEDIDCDDESKWKVVTKRKPTELEMAKMKFAWKIVTHLKSNAIAICQEDRTIGLGMGQTSRIDSTEIAIAKAKKFGLRIKGCALGSDAFFPFRDSIDTIAKLGIVAVIQPGGSVRDAEVIKACDEHNITMIFTGMRHFRH